METVRFLSRQEVSAIIRRASRRLGTEFSKGLLESLSQELGSTPLNELAKRGFVLLTQEMPVIDQARYLAYQEAGFFYNAAPLGCSNGESSDFNVVMDYLELQKMKKGRDRFVTDYNDLLALSKYSWNQMPDQSRIRQLRFGYEEVSNPTISLCIPCLSARVSKFVTSLGDILRAYSSTDIELIVTIADAENLSFDSCSDLERVARTFSCPMRIIFNTEINLIGINRNLASREAKGKFCVFLDDDVYLVGPVLDRLIEALIRYSEIGLVSIPSYDVLYSNVPRWNKPRWHNLKLQLVENPEIVIVNLIPGMIMATRREIAHILPFPVFWPNTGEDYFFSEEVNRLGFLNAYIFMEDCWIEHIGGESQSGAGNPKAFEDILCSSSLVYYLLPDSFEDLREGLTVRLLQNYFAGNIPVKQTQALWHSFRSCAVSLLNGDKDAFSDWQSSDKFDNEWIRERAPEVYSVIGHLEDHQADIFDFKHSQFEKRNLTELKNSYLGPLRYMPYSVDKPCEVLHAKHTFNQGNK